MVAWGQQQEGKLKGPSVPRNFLGDEIFHILIDCGGDFMTVNIFENLSDGACTSK